MAFEPAYIYADIFELALCWFLSLIILVLLLLF